MQQPPPQQQHHHPAKHHHQPMHQAVLQPPPFHTSSNQANSQYSIHQPHHAAPEAAPFGLPYTQPPPPPQQQRQHQHYQQHPFLDTTSFADSSPPPSYTQRDTSVMTGVLYTHAPPPPHASEHQPLTSISLRPLTASGHSTVTPQPPSPNAHGSRRPLDISELRTMWRQDADVMGLSLSAASSSQPPQPAPPPAAHLRASGIALEAVPKTSPVSREPVSLAAHATPSGHSGLSPASASSKQLSEASTSNCAWGWAAGAPSQSRGVTVNGDKMVWVSGTHPIQLEGYMPPVSALSEQALGPRAVGVASPPQPRLFGITDSWTQTPVYLQADTYADIDDKLAESVRKVLEASHASNPALSSFSPGITNRPKPKEDQSFLAASRLLEDMTSRLSEAQRQNSQLVDEREALGQGFRQQSDAMKREIEDLRRECESLNHEALSAKEEPREAVEVLKRVEGQLNARHGERELQLQRLNEELRGDVAAARSEMQTMVIREGKLTAALESATSRAAMAEQALVSMRGSVDRSRGNVDELAAERDSLLGERAALIKRLHAAEASQVSLGKLSEESENAAAELEALKARERDSKQVASDAEERARAEAERCVCLKREVTSLKMRLVEEARRAERAESMLEARGAALDESVEA